MAINIQEQFNVNIALPIDSRIVASGSVSRNAIQNKYDGLIVYDTGERKTYVWNAVTSNFVLSDLSGGGTVNGLAKWTSASGLTSSGIYMVSGVGSANGRVGINTSSPNEVFQVNSISSGSQPFVIHKGSVHNIIGSNWFNTGSDSYNSLTVGSNIIKFQSNGETLFLNRVNGNSTALNSSDGYNSFTTANFGPDRINLHRNTVFNNSALGSIVSAAYIRARYQLSTKTTPDYTWWNDDQTGIYHPVDNKIGFSVEGEQKMILTTNGLAITGSDNVTAPSSRLHLDSGNNAAAYIQFTSGTLTGFGSNTGVLMGINSAGYPVFQSRYQNAPYLFVFSNGNSYHSLRRNKTITYSWSGGENFASVSALYGGDGSRTERISWEVVNAGFGGGAAVIWSLYQLEVPNNTFVSIEVTFTTSVDPLTGTSQFRTNKIHAGFICNGSGSVTSIGTAVSVVNLGSSSSSGIGPGYVASTAANSLNFQQLVGSGISAGHTIYTVVDIVAVFNINVGA